MAQTMTQQQLHPPSQLAGPVLDLLLLEFGVSAMSAAISGWGNLGRASLFVAVARACGHFGSGPFPDERRISVNALSASLRRPFETTRRTANALIDAGLLMRCEAGLCVSPAATDDPRVTGFGQACHDLFVRLTDDLHASNLALPPSRADARYEPRVGIGLAFDLFLAVFECREGDDRGLTRIALLTAIEWSNRRFGGSDAVDAHSPVKPSTIARLLGLPYATVARNLDLLVREGLVDRCPGGLIMAERVPIRGAGAGPHDALANRARQLIGRLAQSGFPTHMPVAGYVMGRPPLPALG